MRAGRMVTAGLTAALLAGCAHTPEPSPVLCPTPAGELLVTPERLAPVPAGPLTQADAIRLWLEHIRSYEILRDRHARLQAWGQAQCQWPAPGPATRQGAGGAG